MVVAQLHAPEVSRSLASAGAILLLERFTAVSFEPLRGLESSMPIEIGHVEAIFRYPVKSMSGERLEVAKLGWHDDYRSRR